MKRYRCATVNEPGGGLRSMMGTMVEDPEGEYVRYVAPSDVEERAYIRGQRAAYRSILDAALTHIGETESAQISRALMLAETRAQLGILAKELGCDTYPMDLHPADIISKYIAPLVTMEERDR